MTRDNVGPHWPVVTPSHDDGEWLAFCAECSRVAGVYVFPCKVLTNNAWPPAVLYDRAEP